jgi:hypothetical protein
MTANDAERLNSCRRNFYVTTRERGSFSNSSFLYVYYNIIEIGYIIDFIYLLYSWIVKTYRGSVTFLSIVSKKNANPDTLFFFSLILINLQYWFVFNPYTIMSHCTVRECFDTFTMCHPV